MDEGPALGALICAIYGTTNKSYNELWKDFNQVKKVYKPNTKAVQTYDSYFKKFKQASDKMNQEMN